jgi:NitT/TauT family transport system substrate-binding protein
VARSGVTRNPEVPLMSTKPTIPPARSRLGHVLAALAALLVSSGVATAADKVTFLTSWFAQAEHGGFYQAKATGLYEKAGLDVTVKMGGPQVNGMQLLLAGEADVMMGYDLQVLKALEQGFPLITVGTSFQFDLQGMMTHDNVTGLGELKDKTILVATPGRSTWWPWLKAKYKYSEEQTRPYTFNLQPFFADPNVVQQAYPTSEPFQAEQKGMPVKFFLFAADGYSPYGTTMVANRSLVDKKPDVIARFVKASLEGWKSYLADPAPANALIKADNPNMGDAQLAFAVRQLKALKVLDGGDAANMGIGIMTPERWKATYDFAVAAGLLKPSVDWKAAFTDRFVKDLKIAM